MFISKGMGTRLREPCMAPVPCPVPIPSPSYSARDSASYTRTVFSSPISWCRYCNLPSSSSSQLLSPLDTQEHVPTSPPDKPLSDHVRRVNVKPSSPARTQYPLSRILTCPDKLHPTLSCWIKNINKQSSLIVHLQDLASSAPAGHRSQLSRQVSAFRTIFKKQQEHCIEFLTLSEECANGYLLDISAEIQ